MTAREQVEQAAIAAAEAYAKANGAPRAAAGLVLAGMVIGAGATQEARKLLIAGYIDAHPVAVPTLMRWMASLNLAAAE